MWKKIILVIVILAIALVIGIYNINNNPDFMKVSVDNILGLLGLALITITYTFLEFKDNKKKELVIELVDTIKALRIQNDTLIKQSTSEYRHFLMLNNELKSKMSFLEKLSVGFKLENEIEYMNERVSDYDLVITQTSGAKVNEIKKAQAELDRTLLNIENKCFVIKFKIHGIKI